MLPTKEIKYAVSSANADGSRIVDVFMTEEGRVLIKIESIQEGVIPISHTLLLTQETAAQLYSCLHSLANNAEKYATKPEDFVRNSVKENVV